MSVTLTFELKNLMGYLIFNSALREHKNTLKGIENKQRLETLSIDNAWSNKNFLYYLTFRMLQHTPSEVNGYNGYYVGKTKRR